LKGELKPKSTISVISKFFFNMRKAVADHPIFTTILVLLTIAVAALVHMRRGRSRSGFFRLDEKMGMGIGMDGLLGGGGGRSEGGKND